MMRGTACDLRKPCSQLSQKVFYFSKIIILDMYIYIIKYKLLSTMYVLKVP